MKLQPHAQIKMLDPDLTKKSRPDVDAHFLTVEIVRVRYR